MSKGSGRSIPDSVIFDDGKTYEFGWKPLYEVSLEQGDAIVFPAGWIHETKNRDLIKRENGHVIIDRSGKTCIACVFISWT